MKTIEKLQTIISAMKEGFELDEYAIDSLFSEAEDYLRENPVSRFFTNVELSSSGVQQYYWYKGNNVSGDIFDFGHYKAEDEVYFRKVKSSYEEEEPEENFEPVNWFDIPEDGDPRRKEFIFVFDYAVRPDGSLAMLYDYMA